MCRFLIFLVMTIASTAFSDRYVWTNSPFPGSPYDAWTNAAHDLQTAVTAASDGETVLVTNGSYILTAAIYVANKTIRSVNGREVTILNGTYPDITNRCFYMDTGGLADGFTINNFAVTDTGGGVYLRENARIINSTIKNCRAYEGGGAYLAWGGTISNCQISSCTAGLDGGGVFLMVIGLIANSTVNCNTGMYTGGIRMNWGGKVTYCTVKDNVTMNTTDRGGAGIGAHNASEISQCLIIGNRAPSYQYGAGLFLLGDGTTTTRVFSCTIASNYATQNGGISLFAGVYKVDNSVIYGNLSDDQASRDIYLNSSGIESSFFYSCSSCTLLPTAYGNITNDPEYVSAASGDYRLSSASPCINTGSNQAWMINAVDLDGRRRLDFFSGRVDMGCYEYLPSGTMVVIRNMNP